MQVLGRVRRTLNLDASRASSGGGTIQFEGSGWDEFSVGGEAADWSGPANRSAVRLMTAPDPAYVIECIASEPADEGLAALLGTSARNGFRPRLSTLQGRTAPEGSLLRRILEDVPSVVSLSRLAVVHADAEHPVADPTRRTRVRQAPIDVCSGWASGSSMALLVDQGRSPVAGHDDPLVDEDDDFTFPGVGALTVGWFRRRRQLTVDDSPKPGVGTIRIQARFRDSYVMVDGRERVEHEYSIRAGVDAASRCFLSCNARPGSLPAPECRDAKESAEWLVGSNLDDVALRIRQSFQGPMTCTHLNEALHGLADAPSMLDAMRLEVAG